MWHKSWLFFLVPEEILALGLFLFWCASYEDGLECVGVVAGGVHRRGCGHGGWGEVLHLFKTESQMACLVGQRGHVLFVAAGMRADEVRNDLLAQAAVAVDLIELPLKVVEEAEGGLAHKCKDAVAGVLGGYF